MAKARTTFECQHCGHHAPKWMGKCPDCGSWNSFVEGKIESATKSGSVGPGTISKGGTPSQKLSNIQKNPVGKKRLLTGLPELDRVLGGGSVADSFILIGGDPGIGKSTILLQAAAGLIRNGTPEVPVEVLYISGEESAEQILDRAHRLGITALDSIHISSENRLERALEAFETIKPKVVIVDSLQTLYSPDLDSSPGSVSQVREVAAKLMQLAKGRGVNVWLVGHVTKEGSIAGPKVVEHLVDTVLYFEGDSSQSFRILRAVKNRFGGTHEIGVFEMTETGLSEVTNPSALFLTQRTDAQEGVATAALMEGTRPMLVEVQALVVPSTLHYPRRTSSGVDQTRLSLWCAILERYLEAPLTQNDVFFNVAGGFRLSETAGDLAGIAALYSSVMGIPLPPNWLFIGEIGLTGEVRTVSHLQIRMEEAAKTGFRRVFVPKRSLQKLNTNSGSSAGVEWTGIQDLRELSQIFSAMPGTGRVVPDIRGNGVKSSGIPQARNRNPAGRNDVADFEL